MFNRLRDLFKKTEPVEETLAFSFDDLPGWLGAREEEIDSGLLDATAPSREAITGALERLRGGLPGWRRQMQMRRSTPDSGYIEEGAPQFTKSMAQILSREPSGAGDLLCHRRRDLKSALKAMKGQESLSSSYPDEMKEVRTAVRDLGRRSTR